METNQWRFIISFSSSLSIKSSLPLVVSRELKSSLNSGLTIKEAAVCIRAVPSCTPHSFTIFIVSVMVGTRLVGGADDASTLVEILSAAFSIFKQVDLYKRKNGLFSSFSSTPIEVPLRFLFPRFTVISFCVGFTTSSTLSSLASSDDISPGQDAEDPVTCALPNKICRSSRNLGPCFRNLIWWHLIPFSRLLHLYN